MKKAAVWLNISVGLLWIGIGFFDLLVPHFFAINGRLGSTSKTLFDFAGGVTFLCVGLVLYFVFYSEKAKSRDLKQRQT
jgi:hypothetical protein